jgi:hypothetical protein
VAFKATLTLDGKKEITVINCKYGFTQDVDVTGKVVSSIKGSLIHLTIEGTDDTELLSWMLTHNQRKNGTISFFKSDNESALKKLYFKDGVCVSYSESFSAIGTSPLTIELVISARIIEVGTAKQENYWEAPKI